MPAHRPHPHPGPTRPDPAHAEAEEILLASSPGGNAVMHIYDGAGRRLETSTGPAEILRAHAARYYPGLAVKQLTA